MSTCLDITNRVLAECGLGDKLQPEDVLKGIQLGFESAIRKRGWKVSFTQKGNTFTASIDTGIMIFRSSDNLNAADAIANAYRTALNFSGVKTT